jgi:protein phosphatase 1L
MHSPNRFGLFSFRSFNKVFMTTRITNATHRFSFVSSIQEIEADENVLKHQAYVDEVAKEIFGKASLMPSVIKDLIADYIFTDITRVYKTAGIDFIYIPKEVPKQNEEILTASERENRIRRGEDNIISREVREFEYAQVAMDNEQDNLAFKYLEAPAGFPYEEVNIGNHRIGISSIRGRRDAMEDAHIVKEFQVDIGKTTVKVPLFGVFDGHGGVKAAKYAKDHLEEVLQDTLKEFYPDILKHEGMWNALKMTCVRLNIDCRSSVSCTVGSTLLFAIEMFGKLWIVNVGDSRAVLNNGGTFIQLSEDAKPTTPRFEKCINNRGGKVLYERLDGDLGVSRAIGDARWGKFVSARPKITMLPLSFVQPGSDLLLGCDGNFSVASTRQILQVDYENNKVSPGELCGNLVFSAYTADSQDNLSMLLIRFL